MDKETLKALKQSIKNWEMRARGEDVYEGCPLCALFEHQREYSLKCVGCPVYVKSSKKLCQGTPFQNWSHFDEIDEKEDEKENEKFYAAQEVKFLKSLLPQAARRRK